MEGTNIRKALRLAPEAVRAYIVREVASLCKEMDMNKTITTDEELQFVCRTIMEDFPALKIEEIKLALDRIRKGEVKLYERLKGAEILIALKEYEGVVRAPILEELHHLQKQSEKSIYSADWIKSAVGFLEPQEPSVPKIKEGVGTRLRKKWGDGKA